MALVVLLRGVNVGKKRFSPAALADHLADIDTTSIGAAGTFVVRGKTTPAALRKRIADWLPFECEIIVASEKAVRAAVAAGEHIAIPEGAKRFVTAMEGTPKATPPLPLDAPPKGAWGVQVVAIEGPFALGLRKRVDEGGVYPNEVVEKAVGVAATTRDWPTMEKIVAALDGRRHSQATGPGRG